MICEKLTLWRESFFRILSLRDFSEPRDPRLRPWNFLDERDLLSITKVNTEGQRNSKMITCVIWGGKRSAKQKSIGWRGNDTITFPICVLICWTKPILFISRRGELKIEESEKSWLSLRLPPPPSESDLRIHHEDSLPQFSNSDPSETLKF